jgi:tetratricopeptide (TPR) repeat protein
MDSAKLKRILIALIAVTALAVAVFAVVYYFGRHVDSGPTKDDRSVATAEENLRKSPNDVGVRLSLAAAYAQAKRPDDALAQFQEVLKYQKENKSALVGAGIIMFQKDSFADAKPYFQKVIKLGGGGEFAGVDPQLQESYYYLGLADLRLKDPAAAVKSLESAVKMDSGDADAWNALGDAHLAAGSYAKSAAAYVQALAFVPVGWCTPYGGMEKAYAGMGKPEGVTLATSLSKVCEGEGMDAAKGLEGLTTGEFAVPAMVGLGLAAERDGDTKAASSWFEKVLALDSRNVTALSALARLDVTNGSSAHSGSAPTSQASAS